MATSTVTNVNKAFRSRSSTHETEFQSSNFLKLHKRTVKNDCYSLLLISLCPRMRSWSAHCKVWRVVAGSLERFTTRPFVDTNRNLSFLNGTKISDSASESEPDDESISVSLTLFPTVLFRDSHSARRWPTRPNGSFLGDKGMGSGGVHGEETA